MRAPGSSTGAPYCGWWRSRAALPAALLHRLVRDSVGRQLLGRDRDLLYHLADIAVGVEDAELPLGAVAAVEYGPDPVGHGPMGHGPMGYGGGPIGTGPFVGGPRMGGPGGPPPGTLGMTYRRSSRPVPTEKHPRAGIVDVSVEDAYDVDAEGMKAYRAKDGIWRLETKEPLIPGLPHIYHIKATLGEAEDSPVEYRTVRLIPGRIVDLQW